MTYVGLFFVGAVYFINGLGLLGQIDARSAAPMNLMVGASLLMVAGYILLPLADLGASVAIDQMFSSVGEVLFGFTFLYVGIAGYSRDSGSGVGWYCGWSCLVSLGISLLDMFRFDDFKGASLWGVWFVVFAAFFILGVLKADKITRATGWFVALTGFTTCVYPGTLQILGLWPSTPVWQVASLCGASVVLFLALVVRSYARWGYARAAR